MRKIPLLILAAIGITIACSFIPAKKSKLDFKVYLKPNHIYTQVSTNTSHMEMTFIGSDDFLKSLKERGVPNPKIQDTTEVRTNITHTGSMKGKQFPVIITLDNSYSHALHMAGNAQINIYGRCEEGKMPVLDSVDAPELAPELKNIFLTTMQSTLSQVSLPEKKLSVGDTFSLAQPLHLPVGTSTMDMNIKTVYRLEKTTKDSAWFSTTETYTFQTNVQSVPVTATGSGAGHFTYDIKNNFYSHYKTLDTLNMNFTYQSFSMKMKAVMGVGFEETIADNK